MKHEVFCINCKYTWNGIQCEHPDNAYQIITYYNIEIRHRLPSFLNGNNDCKWFERYVPKLTLKDKILMWFYKFFNSKREWGK